MRMGDATLGEVLFIRHPHTTANIGPELSGRTDVELSPKGEEQRVRAVEAICAWKPDRIWTSPLSRCHRVSDEAAERLGLSCVDQDGLCELSFGVMEGIKQNAEGRYFSPDGTIEFPWHFDDEGHSIVAPGAETFEEGVERARGLLKQLQGVEGRTACVAHGGIMRCLLCAAYGGSMRFFWHMDIPNVSSVIMRYTATGFRIRAFGLTPEEVISRGAAPVVSATPW